MVRTVAPLTPSINVLQCAWEHWLNGKGGGGGGETRRWAINILSVTYVSTVLLLLKFNHSF